MDGSALPLRYATIATVDNNTVLDTPTRAIHVPTSGDLEVRMAGSQNAVLFTTLPAGIHYISADKVMEGSTENEYVILW